jgi:hypothetical protein
MHPTDIGIGHDGGMDDCADEEQMFEKVVEALSPFVQDLGLSDPTPTIAGGFFRKFWNQTKTHMHYSPSSPATAEKASSKTVWEALLSLPRRSLDAYQPLVNLRTYFNDKLVPSIDYYTVKLNYTTSLITEQRARTLESFPATSTAFVTFADPRDARKACQYLAVHPSNPLACLVTMAPSYSDLDWHRLMKPAIDVEVCFPNLHFEGMAKFGFLVYQGLGSQLGCLGLHHLLDFSCHLFRWSCFHSKYWLVLASARMSFTLLSSAISSYF